MTASLVIQVAIGGLLMGLIYALVAAGLSLIFGLMNIVNFAHGELLMVAMYAALLLHDHLHVGLLLQLPIVAALLFGVGVAIYRGLISRALGVRFNSGMVQIFITFGLSIFLVGLAQFMFGSDFRTLNDGAISTATVARGPIVLPVSQIAAGGVCLLAFAALALISRTEFGRALEATREDRDAVALIGIDRDHIFSLGWGIGAATVGIAGVMLASFYYIAPSVGTSFAVIAYITVALGGFGSLLGALVAGLVVGLVEALTALFIDPSLKEIGIFALYVLVLMVRPRGLFGRQ
ncbi:MAG: amino acid ABC transporter permease [Acidiphilium sp. 37-64-53]|uniref:branched-chain amino acid ABC transporter permease n=1 Tax=Acidiphilium TaxID=522 RepID=UPI000BC7D7A0|nr:MULTISPECIES: branched-chain amino acid ABC transporter permease [Acidiphilium]OYW00459.1 MAG: amino acid ABC transporter permease [Acidiphilium sp. 37-64-53]OZB29462.1 MAG: amino acid ABC transporter permease [Acidiphilium sp. 34-64-41]HQT85873.1 branched-chain amino acid ABC transporter permease [Acidiphilium rubrum]